MDIPASIGIIPDGNRRCAMRLMKQPSKGHEWGVGKLREVLEWCRELGIKNVTFYSLSLENMEKRPRNELNFLFRLARQEIAEMIDKSDSLVHRNKIKLNFFGSLERLPGDLRDDIKRAEEATRSYSGSMLNVAIAYGGRQELVNASRNIALKISQGDLKPEEVNEMVIRQNLQTNGSPDPDLVIRTGGEKRISNFLIFQAAYSEFSFIDTFWPELRKEEFMSIIDDYSRRQRRFGGQ
jgi:tritrans,polycis-undecaprenyl-diphosphate synthase [geranylgeranyl-diphosphate specific]